jgi:DinB superfamily
MSEILSSIRAIMASTPQRWAQLAALPEERLRERPAPGEWSAVECLQHMVDTERLGFSVRLAALRRGEDIPALGAEDLAGQGGPPPTMAALIATFTELRAANLAVLAQVGEHELARGGAHSELGPVTVGELLHEWAAHDFDHTIQAERALMQPFIRGCGPWQPFFAANRIDQPA